MMFDIYTKNVPDKFHAMTERSWVRFINDNLSQYCLLSTKINLYSGFERTERSTLNQEKAQI
jgi:hypothetical protein